MPTQHYLRLWTESSGTTISKVVDLDKNKLLVTTMTSWRHLCIVKLRSRSSSENRKVVSCMTCSSSHRPVPGKLYTMESRKSMRSMSWL